MHKIRRAWLVILSFRTISTTSKPASIERLKSFSGKVKETPGANSKQNLGLIITHLRSSACVHERGVDCINFIKIYSLIDMFPKFLYALLSSEVLGFPITVPESANDFLRIFLHYVHTQINKAHQPQQHSQRTNRSQ